MAVYTEVSAEDLGDFSPATTSASCCSYKGIAEGVENSNFLLHTGTGSYILTLYEKRVAAGGPAVLPGADGASRHARHHLPAAGEEPRRRERSARLCRAAGGDRHLPRRHVAAPARRRTIAPRSARRWRSCISPAPTSPMTRPNALSVDGWRPLFEQAADARRQRAAGPARPRSTRSLACLETELAGATCRRASSTPTCFPDNVFFLGDRLSGPDRLLFRLHRHARLRRRDLPQRLVLRARPFLQRHQGRGAADRLHAACGRCRDAELAALPLLARGAALRFLLTRLVDWLNVPPGALVKPKDPLEYFRKLRFHQRRRACATTACQPRARA